MRYELTDEFQLVLALLGVESPRLLFVTGSAGTGKSTLIDGLRAELDRNLVVVAPTGGKVAQTRTRALRLFLYPRWRQVNESMSSSK